MSTGFYLPSCRATVPLLGQEQLPSADDRYSMRSCSPTTTLLPPSTPRTPPPVSWRSAVRDRTDESLPRPRTSGVALLDWCTEGGEKSDGCLACVLVALALGAFLCIFASALLSENSGMALLEPQGELRKGADADPVLHLEGNSAGLPSPTLERAGGGDSGATVLRQWRIKAQPPAPTKASTSEELETTESPINAPDREQRPIEAGSTRSRQHVPTSGIVFRTTQNTNVGRLSALGTQDDERDLNSAPAVTPKRGVTHVRSRNKRRNSKRRYRYPRVHIPRTKTDKWSDFTDSHAA